MNRVGLMFCAVCVAASGAAAQTPQRATVQLRIVERTGQTSASPTDNVLDFAVQMMSNAQSVRDFGFHIRIMGEPEANGTLQRSEISNADGTYSNSLAVNNTVGRGGLASQYTYYAGINPGFNGSINQAVSVFPNGPDQEILAVTGISTGSALLRTPGLDQDSDGNPDTWSGNGSGVPPANETLAALDPALTGPYFASGQFIDVYHFRYTVSSMTPRSLRFTLQDATADVAVQLKYVIGLWGFQPFGDHGGTGGGNTFTVASPLDISVVPAPALTGATLAALGACVRVRRNRR